MRFEWDPEKARTNRLKHGISFEFATRAWDDPLRQILPDRVENNEERWRTIAMIGAVMVVVVIHTHPGRDDDLVRIVSARKATPHERRSYENEAL